MAFVVRDQGPGIDDALLPRLFEPFVQGESPLVKRHPGAGLGLAICKRLVKMHGGTISVDPAAMGVGATFRFTMPRAYDDQRPTSAPTSRTLLVHDDPRSTLASALEDSGYSVVRVQDAAETVRLATSLHPLAVVVAPETEHGLAILDSLRRQPETATIPLVANAAPGARFLPKPVDGAALIAELSRRTDVNTAFSVLVLVVSGDPRTGESLRAKLEPEGYRVAIARSGNEGVALAQSEEPEVIIVEPLLEDLTGFEVIAELAASDRTRATPVVMLTVADPNAAERTRLRQRASAVASTVPLGRIVAAVRSAGGRITPSRGTSGARTVLVVDDNELNRELARLLLEPIGCRVLLASDGNEAIETARREGPHLILLDLMMPQMDGYTAARILQADAVTASIPIVALTARAMRGDEDKARACGITGYLTKPIDRHAFDACVRSFLT